MFTRPKSNCIRTQRIHRQIAKISVSEDLYCGQVLIFCLSLLLTFSIKPPKNTHATETQLGVCPAVSLHSYFLLPKAASVYLCKMVILFKMVIIM